MASVILSENGIAESYTVNTDGSVTPDVTSGTGTYVKLIEHGINTRFVMNANGSVSPQIAKDSAGTFKVFGVKGVPLRYKDNGDGSFSPAYATSGTPVVIMESGQPHQFIRNGDGSYDSYWPSGAGDINELTSGILRRRKSGSAFIANDANFGFALLLESGDYLLLESGDKILLE